MALLLHNGWHTPHSPGAGGVLIKLGHMKPFPPLLVLLGSTISSHPSRFIKALPLYRRWSKGYCEWKRFPWKKEKKKSWNHWVHFKSLVWASVWFFYGTKIPERCTRALEKQFSTVIWGWGDSAVLPACFQYSLATSSGEYEHKYSRLQPRTPYHTAGSGWQHAFSNKLII